MDLSLGHTRVQQSGAKSVKEVRGRKSGQTNGGKVTEFASAWTLISEKSERHSGRTLYGSELQHQQDIERGD
jgi:hypothetical protein